MRSSHLDISLITAQIAAAPGIERLQALNENLPDAETLAAIISEAARLGADVLRPLNVAADRSGCRLESGRVIQAPGYADAWEAFKAGGWPSLDQKAEWGGQDLPLVVQAASQELFDRENIGFGMLPTAQRAAARLIDVHADDTTKAEWLPKLVSGEWGATICISEPEAGSDVGRARTMARQLPDGQWVLTGEKCWISFGDHDLAPRIGHCVLARTPSQKPGGAGLSLFLVANVLADGSRNAIHVRRIEEKMGLHGSPTCALGFEDASATLIGEVGRGLPQIFTMIGVMRVAVSTQGLGVAAGSAAVAQSYAAERRQGGPPHAAPVPIAHHADIQRMLLGMVARVEMLRGLIYALAVTLDLAALEPNPETRHELSAFAQWLLPIAKTIGAETAFDVSSDAIQVLGGAGYVREWPVEQAVRDARVFSIYEGTSGIQALDLLHRRLWREEGKGLAAFLRAARAEPLPPAALNETLDLLEDAARRLDTMRATPREAEAGATNFLHLAGLAVMGWIAVRLVRLAGTDAAGARLRAAGEWWLSDLVPRAQLEHHLALQGAARLALFDCVREQD